MLSNDIPTIVLSFLIFGIFAVFIPGFFTAWNIGNLFGKKVQGKKTISTLTILVGGILYLMLFSLFNTAGDWYEAVYPDQLHYTMSSEYSAFFDFPVLFGLIGLFLLLYMNPQKMPPLVSVFSIASVILLNILSVVYAIQLSGNTLSYLQICFYVYHFNILLVSVIAVREHMKAQAAYLSSKVEEFKDRKNLLWLYMKVTKVSQYALPVFMAVFILAGLLEIYAVLEGQGVDAPVKLFTDTADWTFSKQIPPPPKEYEGHYLCTVAAGGHEKVVKPVRLGRRRDAIIVVNRQLCIANAFEESIAERFPKFHRWIRHVYDTYGYPLSELITTPGKADVVYILMKPLEWVFLLYLYLTDSRPEIRINRQYKL